jgi:pseudouridine synthase
MRIQKYISEQGIASRREAEELIRQGRVKLNGAVVTEMGVKIDPLKDKVEVAGAVKAGVGERITVLVYKPRGVTCSRNRAEGKSVFDVFSKFANLNAVGRLDKESEGLLLLSNDGLVTKAVTGEEHLVEKEYEVAVREDVLPWQIEAMERGIELDGRKTLPARAEKLDCHTFRLAIREGRHHQIRRMADALRLTIERLVRIRIGSIEIGELAAGQARILGSREVKALKGA